jgi:DNA mismatch endonuclease (patch repair protein)
MADVVDKATRSRMMAGIRGKNTQPELSVRRYLHGKGLRFKLCDQGLPGKPDIVLPKWRAVVFVHGCFWHRHAECKYAATPKSNSAFWISKLEANRNRDAKNQAKLRDLGWRVFVLWECQISEERLLELVCSITKFRLGNGA